MEIKFGENEFLFSKESLINRTFKDIIKEILVKCEYVDFN